LCEDGGDVSVGSRQTRRKRRARRRRAQRKKNADAVLFEFFAGVHMLTRSIEWSVLFFALMLSLVVAVVTALFGAIGFAGFFFVLSLFLCLALWTRELG
jgi:apolipoprotein N-acyltransferase